MSDCHRHKLHPIEFQSEVSPCLESATRVASEDFLKCDPFFRVGTIVNEKTELAVLIKDITFPMDDEDDRQILGKGEVPVVALADQPGEDAFAESVGRIGAEIARAADGAIAKVPPVSGEPPIRNWCCVGCRHQRGHPLLTEPIIGSKSAASESGAVMSRFTL